ncbi:MAG: GWxTD domain-containing protein, partial [Candidatus Aminicenantes bacterium]|nr:GWxTD domain-containing protein [Candidatus Aminicenantes bacterium]
MRASCSVCLLLLICLAVWAPVAAGAPGQSEGLPAPYKKWLEEEVVYIISSLEKQVFERLPTDRERDLFISAFWKQRDPTPGTEENEFKAEHYRRINHANHYYGRQVPLPGWRTDRGRIYIILGEPNDIQRFESGQETYPAEIWFYQNKAEAGLPPGFNIVFFKKHGTGDYQLYSPTMDGPQAFLVSFQGGPENTMAAYRKLRDLEPNLAQVSLSLIPGDESAGFGRASLSSDLLLQQVEALPSKTVRDLYAKKFLEYKDIIEVEYSANFIDSDSLVKVLKASSAVSFVHYSIEPARLSVSQYEDTFSTNLTLTGSVKDKAGKTIHQFNKALSISFDEEDLKRISRQPYAIYDAFPMIPGSYEFSLLLKNAVSKEFTSLERKLNIPSDESQTWITPLLLGYKAEKTDPGTGKLKPFQIGGVSLQVQANRTFTRSEGLVLGFQVWGFPQNVGDGAEIIFDFLRDGQPFKSYSRRPAEFSAFPDVIEPVILTEFSPAHYKLRVSIRVGGREVAASEDEFDVTSLEKMPRPWVYTKILPGPDDPVYQVLTGNQLFSAGRLDEARNRLETAFHKRPDSEEYALSLARTDMGLGDHSRVIALLLPFYDPAKPLRYELFFLLASAYHQKDEWEKALEILEQGIAQYGLSTVFLNLRGECFLRLGNTVEALRAWEKSLELSPSQPDVQKAVGAL